MRIKVRGEQDRAVTHSLLHGAERHPAPELPGRIEVPERVQLGVTDNVTAQVTQRVGRAALRREQQLGAGLAGQLPRLEDPDQLGADRYAAPGVLGLRA